MWKKSILLALVTVLCLGITVFLRFAADNADREYTKVEVTVLTAETRYKKVGRSSQRYYEITVRYQGKTYDLENAHETYSYTPGKQVKAYLSDGRLFANIEGVKSTGPVATAYFVGLFATFGLVIATASVWSSERKKNRENA